MNNKLNNYAYNKGFKAGKEDGWMFSSRKDINQQLREEIEMGHLSKNGGYEELVQCWQDGWEQTDHWIILYSHKFWDKIDELNIKDGDYRIELWQDMCSEYWRGVDDGLATRKINIYTMAQKILNGLKRYD